MGLIWYIHVYTYTKKSQTYKSQTYIYIYIFIYICVCLGMKYVVHWHIHDTGYCSLDLKYLYSSRKKYLSTRRLLKEYDKLIFSKICFTEIVTHGRDILYYTCSWSEKYSFHPQGRHYGTSGYIGPASVRPLSCHTPTNYTYRSIVFILTFQKRHGSTILWVGTSRI